MENRVAWFLVHILIYLLVYFEFYYFFSYTCNCCNDAADVLLLNLFEKWNFNFYKNEIDLDSTKNFVELNC